MLCVFACTGSSEEQEYSIPSPLCGVELDRALYSPIFPPGEQVHVNEYFNETGERIDSAGSCTVDVDSEQAIQIDWRGALSNLGREPGVADYLDGYNDRTGDVGTYDMREADQVTGNPHETWVWPDLAATSVTCESSSIDMVALNLVIRLDWFGDETFGDEDYTEPLTELIGPFADELVRRIGERICTPA
jgi:hypothetical protein